MKVSIHQPQYLPWPPYLLKAAEADLFISLDTVSFQKNGLQNRNRIKTAAGAQWLTVPVRQHLGQSLRETRIEESSGWRRKHWAALRQNYGKAPYFERFAPELDAVYARPWESLAELDERLLALLFGWSGIKTPIRRASAMKATGKASELVLNLCKEAGATTYLSGVGSKDYLDERAFADAGIAIEWRPPVLPAPYPQRFPEAGFLGDLSCADALFNCGPGWRGLVPAAAGAPR